MQNQKLNDNSSVLCDEHGVMSCLDSFNDEDTFRIELVDVSRDSRCTANLVGRKGNECLFFCLKSNVDSILTKLNKGDTLKIRASKRLEAGVIIAFYGVVQAHISEPFKLLLVKFPSKLTEVKIRKHVRHKANISSVLLFLNNKKPINCVIADISLGGCRIHFPSSSIDFYANEKVVVQVQIAQGFEPSLIEATVINKKLVDGETILGIEFMQETDDISAYIQCLEEVASLREADEKQYAMEIGK